MSVLIKGMEMPKNCGECHFLHNEGFKEWCCLTESEDFNYDIIPSSCPLVEVKTPHGRLIDEDRLIGDISLTRVVVGRNLDGTPIFGYGRITSIPVSRIEKAPTIIEAEE